MGEHGRGGRLGKGDGVAKQSRTIKGNLTETYGVQKVGWRRRDRPENRRGTAGTEEAFEKPIREGKN